MSNQRRSALDLSGIELISAVALFAAILVGFALVTRNASGVAKPSIEIEQCANLDSSCDSSSPSNWQKGNLGQSNSLYFEGQSVPYRSVLSGLSIGQTYVVRLEWDTTEGGKHALDYLTSFDRTEPGADPCAIALCSGPSDTIGIPLDPNVSSAGVTQIGGQVFDLWGGTFTSAGTTVLNTGNLCSRSSCTIASNPSGYSPSGSYEGSSQTSLEIYFTASASTVVLAWGGHISSRLDWGFGNSAVDQSGAPYRMRLTDLRCSDVSNCGTGQKDLSLSSTAVVFPGQVAMVKQSDVESGDEFDFTASPSPLDNFVNSEPVTGVAALDNDQAETKEDCPPEGDWWHFVLTPNSGDYRFVSMVLNLGSTAITVLLEDMVLNSGQFDNVFVAVPGGFQITDLAKAGSTAVFEPNSERIKFVLSHVCEGPPTTTTSTTSTSSTSTTSTTSTSTTSTTSTSSTSSTSTTSTSTTTPTSSTSTTNPAISTSSTTSTSTSTSAPTSTSSTSTTASPPIVIVPAVPIRPAEVTTTPPSTTSAPTTTEEAVILPAEIPSDSTLPSTGSSTRTTSVLGLLLLAIGGLGLVLLAIRSTTTKERNS